MKYNSKDKENIKEYARKLLNTSLREFYGEKLNHRFDNKKSKGRLGQVVEEEFFGYKVNSNKEADFKEAGIELKVAPLKSIKIKEKSNLLREQKGISAKERIVLSIIDYMEVAKETWDNNSLMKKCRELLLMFYLNEKDLAVEDLKFELINLWTPSDEDMKVIEQDWNIIVNKVKEGRAEEISEGDTLYLGACTKGSTADKSKRKQPFSDVEAPQRAFCLKRSYVDSIIEELMVRESYIHHEKYKSVSDKIKEVSFDKAILGTFERLKGLSLREIIEKYDINRERKSKSFNRLVIDDICVKEFGGKLENLTEFKKANVEIKTIVLKTNNMPKESMSFEQIDFCEIVNEEWEDSKIRDKFENKKHLWIIFKLKTKADKLVDVSLEDIILEKVMFWNMPISDLEGSMKSVWKDTVEKIKLGDYDNFIKIKDGEIAHIRPKAKDSSDLMITPQETYEKRKCFWLNAKYIKEQIEKEDLN